MSDALNPLKENAKKLDAGLNATIAQWEAKEQEMPKTLSILVQLEETPADDPEHADALPTFLLQAMASADPGANFLPPELGRVVSLEVTIDQLCLIAALPSVKRIQRNTMVAALEDRESDPKVSEAPKGEKNEREN